MRQVVPTGEVPHVGPTRPGIAIANRTAQPGVSRFQSIEKRALGWDGVGRQIDHHLSLHPREHPEVGGERHPNAGPFGSPVGVLYLGPVPHPTSDASTVSTRGRCPATVVQWSPASADP